MPHDHCPSCGQYLADTVRESAAPYAVEFLEISKVFGRGADHLKKHRRATARRYPRGHQFEFLPDVPLRPSDPPPGFQWRAWRLRDERDWLVSLCYDVAPYPNLPSWVWVFARAGVLTTPIYSRHLRALFGWSYSQFERRSTGLPGTRKAGDDTNGADHSEVIIDAVEFWSEFSSYPNDVRFKPGYPLSVKLEA